MDFNVCAIFLFLRAVFKDTLHLPEMKNIYALLTFAALLFIGTSQTAFTQPPPPTGGGIADICDAALPIGCGFALTDSTTLATNIDQPGTCDTDLSTAPGVWFTFNGDGSSVTLTTCSPNTTYDTKLGVFEGPCASLVCVAGNDDDPTCVNSGLQSTVTFTSAIGTPYFVYVTGFGTNTGVFDITMSCSAPCAISAISSGAQTACDNADNSYTQEVTVTYSDAPATGTLDINGQNFAITSSPQMETLVGLFSDGGNVDVTASFSNDPACAITNPALFTAPANCSASCLATYAGFTATDYCVNDAAVTLIPEPYGGTFSGSGITGDGGASSFSPVGLPLAIPDNVTPGVEADIAVAGIGTAALLSSICLEVAHTWVGDITINLSNPQGTTVALMNRPGSTGGLGFGCNQADLSITVLPGTGNDMEDSCAVGATYAILGSFTAHDGADISSLDAGDPNGTWVVSVIDSAGGDIGSLLSCTLNFGGTGEFDPATAGAGTHDITYTLTTCEGCIATTTQTVNVIAPDASFSYVESGLNVDFLANNVTTTYAWDFGDTNTASTQNPSHTYATGGSYDVTLIATDNGCSDTTTQTITVGTACIITGITVGTQGPCDPATDTYTQSLILEYSDAPTTGALDVNGQSFTITTSPQTVVIIGLNSNGAAVDVTATFSDLSTCTATELALFTAPTSCSASCTLTGVTAGTQGPCDPATDTYTQSVIVEYSDAPASGTLDVNGQSFAITTSPQTVVLVGLISDGSTVDVNALFSDLTSCTSTEIALFTAPDACSVITCPGGTTLIWEQFNDCVVPTDWSTNILNGTDDWQFGDNGGVDNIDGSCMAYFDDDFLTASADPSWIELLSPVVDNSAGDNLELSFDFNYNNLGVTDSFYVDVWNGTTWDNVLLLVEDSLGFWNGGPYPTATYSLAGYTNADFRVRFSYNDGGEWAWYVGLDNVSLCAIPAGACEITGAIAGTQTACDPATSAYDQDVIIEYATAPATGTLDVNGQSFPITGSPQTVTFTGLTADGLAVDISAAFSDDSFCTADFTAVWTAPVDCYDPCPGNTTLIWENFNSCNLPAGWSTNVAGGVDDWQFGDNGGVDNIDGSCMVYFDDDIIGNAALASWVELLSPIVDASTGDNLELSFDFNYNNLGITDSFYVDVWNGASWDNVLLLIEDSLGFWNGGPYPTAIIPMAGYTNTDFQVRFSYNDGGDWAWYVGIDNVALCQIPVGSCEISAVTAGIQTPCDPVTSEYNQDVIIEYSSAPATGTLDVNGQSFPITGSPQTVTFNGLPADGLAVDVSAAFSDDAFCTADFIAVWTAPADCYDPCVGGSSLIWETFNDCQLPAGWINVAVTGDSLWVIGDNGGINNLDGSCMAYFDDDLLGSGALPSLVELTTPTVDASAGDDMQLSFDYNFNEEFGVNDSFYVDVWNGATWDNVLLLTEDSAGFWNGGPYPAAVIPLSGYTNIDFQVRFTYNDGGAWAWYVGLDNVALCAFPPTSCSIDDIVSDTQGACDPVTNEYSQDLIITYSSNPVAGTVDVNGQSFPITGSPQIVSLTGLDSDGLPVDVTANFSDDLFCELTINDLFTAPTTCLPIPINDTCDNAITIACGQSIIDSTIFASPFENPGLCVTDLSTAPGMWYTFIGTGEQVSITTCSSNTNFDTKLGLFEGPCDTLICMDGNDDDFTCPNSGLQSSINNFITTLGVEYLIYVTGFGTGTGVFELTLECAPPCEISNATAGAQTVCDPATNTYTQEVTVEYTNAPGAGFLDVNGQQFAITTSPQTVTLVGLTPNGALADLNVTFTDNPNCSLPLLEAWTAPEDCTPPACSNPNAVTIFSEDFNACEMPADWENNIIAGDSAWLFVLNSPDAFNTGNIDGTCMVLFDDDYLGSGAPASNVELVSPQINLSNYADVNLSFDFNFQDFAGETFYVDAWDGTTWNNLMTITGVDSLGAWTLGPPYPTASFGLAGYNNSDFQIRFGFNDNGNWGWYLGIDNIEVCGTLTGCPPLPITLAGLTYCVGEDSTLVSVLEPYDMYEWSPMGETGQSIWTVAGNYTVNVTDADGCVDSAMVNVIQVDNPVEPVITIAGDLEFCEGGSAVLSGPPGFPQYAWNTGSTTQDITVFESGIYTLYVTDSIGCSSAISSIEIIVNPVPVASFSYTLTDFTVDLTNLTLNATDYSWIAELEIPDSIPPAVIVGTSIAADTAFTFAVGGVYTITLFAENECGSDSTSVTLGIMNIGVQEASGIEGFNMYPNPAHNRLVMDMSLNENRKIDIQFFDQLGQIVLNQRNDLKVGANTINFDLSSLAQGVYSIRIADDQYTQVVKLVKR
jgi:subtilisin-like proprotein convertase family protein